MHLLYQRLFAFFKTVSVDENEAEKMKSSIFLPCIEITVALVNTCESQDDDSDLFESGQQ